MPGSYCAKDVAKKRDENCFEGLWISYAVERFLGVPYKTAGAPQSTFSYSQ